MSNNSGAGAGFVFIVYIFAQMATYIMSAIRWFSTPYHDFWLGFKEMVWALCPVANFFYVWDWWSAAFMFILTIAWQLTHSKSG